MFSHIVKSLRLLIGLRLNISQFYVMNKFWLLEEQKSRNIINVIGIGT